MAEVPNIEALGQLIYTRYAAYFQVSGLILLVAMIGAITLTLRHKPGVKRQSIPQQVSRDPRTAIQVRKVESGKGI
jgi:NADH-quinone oxidoreductase subunit J